ncbi:MAG: hypothetical protein HW380_1794 [Magnetococcales bacterium]|nr:hypothetical protein [Magnetococcales bacterium]HIJ84444.1 cell division protein ZapB [Magnetococcales bacterium]
MDGHGTNATPHQGGQSHNAAGQGHLEQLLSQLEDRWGKMSEMVGKLRDENSFLQEQLRDREEKSGLLEARCHEANQRAEGLIRERDQLAGRIESLLTQMKHFENNH